jgi:hypothetical protein
MFSNDWFVVLKVSVPWVALVKAPGVPTPVQVVKSLKAGPPVSGPIFHSTDPVVGLFGPDVECHATVAKAPALESLIPDDPGIALAMLT